MAGTAPLKSLNAVTAPGNGITFDVQRPSSDWEVQITTTGSPASFAAHLEGAIDGSTLVTVGSSITTTGLTNVTSNTPLTQVRLVLDSLTGGTAPTVTGVIVGDGPAGSGGGGGGGAATIADGADVAEGAKADAAATTDTGVFSLIALFKRLLQKFTTQFPAALGGTTAANSFAVTLSTDGPFVVQTGAINETAPATDIASSGLNGRLQRIAQRISSLIALVPAALTGSGNFKVSLAESTASQAVTNANLDAALSTLVPTTDFDTKVGALTEAAPANDTASSGLNGRLQRIAQNITTMIAATLKVQGAGAAGAALTGNPVLGGISDGTNAQTLKQASPATLSGTAATGIPATGLYASDGTNLRALVIGGDGGSTSNTLAVAASIWNGASMDRQRGNLDVTLLASAARTTTQTSADIVTYNAGAIKVILDVTATVSTVSLTVTINEKDPASGKYLLLLSGAVVAGTGTTEYTVDPMVPAVANVTAQKRVPRTIQIVVTVGNANSQTYSVGYLLLPA